MMTKYGIDISREMICNKFDDLVNQFFKILPLKESQASTLAVYMDGLMREMLGFQSLMSAINNDGAYLNLLSTLQYMIDNDCDVATVKSDVFKSISIIKRLQKKYGAVEE